MVVDKPHNAMDRSGASRAAVDALFDAAGDGLAIVEDGTYDRVSSTYATLLGYDGPDGLAGEPWAEPFLPSDRDRIEADVRPAMEDGRPWRGTLDACRPDGATTEVTVSLEPFGDDGVVAAVRETRAVSDAIDSTPDPSNDGLLREDVTAVASTADGATGEGATGDGRTGSGETDGSRTDPADGNGDDAQTPSRGASTGGDVEDWTHDRTFVKRVLDALDDVFYVVDEEGRFVLWNEKMVETMGDEPEALEPMDPRAFFTPEQRHALPEDWAGMTDQADRRAEFDVLTADGETVPHEFHAVTFEFGGRQYRAGIVRDVSDRRERERALRDSEQRYRSLVENAPVPIGVVVDGVVEYINPAGVDFLGGDGRGDVVGRSALSFVHEDDREQARERLDRVFGEDEVAEPIEERFRTLNGETRTAEVATAPITYDGEAAAQVMINDVTEYKETQRRLEASRERYRRLIEAAPVPIWVQGIEEIEFCNEAAVDFFGAESRADVVGSSDLDFVVPEERERSRERNRRILQDGKVIEGMEGSKVGLDGTVRHGLFAGAPIRYDGEDAILVIARDITERKERQREIERQRDELERINHINDLVLDLIRSLVETDPGEDFETGVCEQLADADPYRFAWIGGRRGERRSVRPRASSGIDEKAVSERIEADASDDPLPSLVADTLRTGTVRTGPDGDGVVATIPIARGDAIEDVLCLGAARSDEFGDRERDGLAALGETIGFVRDAIENRKLLVADAVIELEFAVRDPASPLVAAATAVDGTVALDGYVEPEPGVWLLYLDVRNASPSAVVEALDGVDAVATARVLVADETGGHVEARVTGPSLPRTLLACGGTVKSGTATGDQVRFVVEVPAGTDVRRVLERVTDAYPEATLLAQREREGAVRPPGRVRHLLEEELTDRQRSALQTAYRSGYFEWPRESTAEEVAEAMDISSPTLHSHLRRGERKLLRALFDGEA
jgi:PAS domain S-box-containing protein